MTLYFKNDHIGTTASVDMVRSLTGDQIKEQVRILYGEDMHITFIDQNSSGRLSDQVSVEDQIFPNNKNHIFYVLPATQSVDACGICLENIIGGCLRTTRCNHTFHARCISDITRCPLCRSQL